MIKNIIKTATLTALTTVALSANNIQINPVTDIEPVIKQIEKANLKKPKRTKRSYSVENISNFTYDQTRDTIDTISDVQGPLFYLVRNKVQKDPSQEQYFNWDKLEENTYKCNNDISCNGVDFYLTKVFDNISVGANIVLGQNPTEELVFFNRNYASNKDYPLSSNKPFLKVFIDKDRYLNAKYVLQTGGTTQAKTDKPIPLGEKVYIQANEVGSAYDVGWKSYSSNETSTGHSNRQMALAEFVRPEGIKSVIQDIKDNLNYYTSNYNMSGWFWNSDISMFKNFGVTDLKRMNAYQDMKEEPKDLTVDNAFVNKILDDITGKANHFYGSNLVLYLDDAQNIQAVDVRLEK